MHEFLRDIQVLVFGFEIGVLWDLTFIYFILLKFYFSFYFYLLFWLGCGKIVVAM